MEEITTSISNNVLDMYYNTYGNDTNIDIIKLAKMFGFKVYEDKNMSYLALATLEVTKNKKRIAINSNYTPEAKKYYTALELSYYLINKKDNAPFSDILCEYSLDSMTSKLANEMLMPYDSFIKLYNEIRLEYKFHSKVVEALSKIYNLPESIIDKRVQEILIIKNKVKKRTK